MQNEEDDAVTLGPAQTRLLKLLPPLARQLKFQLLEAPSALAYTPIPRRELAARIVDELAAYEAWKNDLMRVFLGPMAEALEAKGTRATAEQGFAALQAASLAALEHWKNVARWADGQDESQDLVLLWRSMVRQLAGLMDEIVAILEHPERVRASSVSGRRQVELAFSFDAVAPLVSRLDDFAEPYSLQPLAPEPPAYRSSGLGTLTLWLLLGWGLNEWLDED